MVDLHDFDFCVFVFDGLLFVGVGVLYVFVAVALVVGMPAFEF